MCKQTEAKVKETKVFIPEGKRNFTCPLCNKTLRVPKKFTHCNCGHWKKTEEKWQGISWGCNNIDPGTYMTLEKKPIVNQSFFMKAFTKAHNMPFPQEMVPEKSKVKQ